MKYAHRFRITALLVSTFTCSTLSANFEATSEYIDLDGSMVGYMDFAGDGQEIGSALNDIYQKALAASPEMPPVPVDFNLLFDNLGFSSLQAVAMSSKDVEPGLHRNRSVVLFDGTPTGLYALYDNEPMTFTAAKLAPADATGAMTVSVNLRVLRDTVSTVMQQIMGPMGEGMMQQQLNQVVPDTDLSYNELIDSLSGKWDGFWMQSYGEDFQQDVKFWVNIEGAGSLLPRLRTSAESMGVAFVEDEDTLKADLTHLLGPNAQIGLYAEASKSNDALVLYTDADWTPKGTGARLSESPEFKALASRLPEEGLAFTYSKGADLEPMLAALSTMPQAAPYADTIQAAFDFLLGDYMQPSMAVTVMEGNAMYSDQYAGYSTKQALVALPAMVGGGLGAAMAIPAFQKVRATSQEKAVTNNLRKIASAADQYFLETGENSVKVNELTGSDGYIRRLDSVAGEDYMDMVITTDLEVISVELPDGRVFSLPY